MMQFIDLAAQQARIRPDIDAAIARVLDHGKYIMGPEVAQLESELCKFAGAKHCIAVSNGTDALVAALMALDVGPGDMIVTTPFTFFATVEAIELVGAIPIFADIDPTTFNLCPSSLATTIDQCPTADRIKGICTVDLFGLCADYSAINAIAQRHDLFVLQDAAQAFGASTPDGRRAPTHGRIGTTSFFPAKPLGCYGDGGAVFTDDDQLADIVRSIRVHGKGADKYDNVRIGQNCRLDSIQAAVLLEKLKIYPSELQARQTIAKRYQEQFAIRNRQLESPIQVPTVPEGMQSVWAQFTVRCDDRDAHIARLKAAGVPALVYYRTPSHLLGACRHLGYQVGDFPHAEEAAKSVLSLPFHPYLEPAAIDNIVAAFSDADSSNRLPPNADSANSSTEV